MDTILAAGISQSYERLEGSGFMNWLINSKLLLLAVSAGVLCISQPLARTPRMQRIAVGQWGGSHVQMLVKDDSAWIEYDCAHGEISGPLTLDSQGCFTLNGTVVREHGGPIRRNEPQVSQPAVYSGSINGEEMNLTVKLVENDQSIGTFTLTHGQPGRLRKCR